MRNKLTQILSLLLAAALQVLPLLRSLLPVQEPGLAPSTWAIVLKLATGAVAYFGYHAISSASSISISPANAVSNQPYNGTITYSGGHSGSVSSMSCTNVCAGPWTIVPGLTAHWSTGNKATVTGTPTKGGTFGFGIKMYNASSCGSGDTDTRSTALTVVDPSGSNIAPSWTVTPPGQVAQEGSDTILNAAASGKPVPGYYWQLNITPISGATNATLTLTNVQISNAGAYTVFATNGTGTPISTNAYLTVIRSPSTLLFHYTNYLARGSSTNLSCVVSNTALARTALKWLINGVNTGVSTPNFPLSNVGTAPFVSGTYTVAIASYITNATTTNFLAGTSFNSGQGFDSYWIFGDAPTITTDLTSLTNAPGSPAVFSVGATGDTTLSGPTPDAFGRSMLGTNYQWYTNSLATPLVGQTADTLTLNSVTAANAGNYFVVITNVYGAVTSSVATLTVNSVTTQAPGITNQPVSQIVPQGATVQLSVTAGGVPTPTYQWANGSGNLTDGVTGTGSTIAGSQTNTLTIFNAQPADSGSYTVGITNSAGSTNSNPAQLLVVAPAGSGPQLAKSVGAGQFNLSFATLAGYRYILQSSTNLSAPVTWVDLTNLAPAFSGGLFNFADPIVQPKNFYRAFITNQ